MRALQKVWWLFCALLCVGPGVSGAEGRSVEGDVTIVATAVHNQAPYSRNNNSNVVIWLVPLDEPAKARAQAVKSDATPRIIQRDKTFEPHLLAVEVGTVVTFPNQDPFFHNIFSLFEGKRFDLGLYEAGSSRSVRFDRPGVSFLFCNIHPEMSAVVVVVETPYFALTNREGHWEIPDVPDGRFELHVWYERGLAENLKALTRTLEISASNRSLDRIRVAENPNFTLAHKNKYGQDYVPPPVSGYVR